jgi:Peptidase family M28/PDZ domain/PA domain
MRGIRHFLLICLLAGLVAGCHGQPAPPAQLQAANTELIRHSIEYLSSDQMEGRGPGTEGINAASNYIACYFKGLGLQPPPGQKSYFQPFHYVTVNGVDPKTNLKTAGKSWKIGDDFTPLAVSSETEFSGPVVFVGYGIAADKDKDGKAIQYDDYANIDVHGKVALALRFEPVDNTGKSRLSPDGWSDHAALLIKAKLAAEHGATALLIVHPPTHHGPELLAAISRRLGDRPATIPVVHIKQHVAEELLKSAGVAGLQSYQSSIDESFAPKSFALNNISISGGVALNRNNYELNNVEAFLPAKGKHAKEYIVVGAHYDHLGRGGQGSLASYAGQIHHGADDNASGTAAIMELARLLSSGPPLPRSVVFVAFSGEEEGLLGSQHWVSEPPVPLKQVVTMINLDMVGRVKDKSLLVGGVGTAAPFEEMLKRLDEQSPLDFKSTWRNGIAPSDNTSFVAHEIPVLFFFSGLHADYHRPTDTADKINYEGEAEVINIAAKAITEIASRDDLAFIAVPTTGPTTRLTDPTLRSGGASLGVIPDYSGEEVKGVKITGTTPNSAAAKAGLKANDILTQFDTKKIETLYDLTDALNAATPGRTIKLQILRDGKPMTLEATPTARAAPQ